MPRVIHVDALPQVVVGEEDDVLRARADANEVEHVRELDARPLRDERPSLLARLMRDLRGDGHPFQVVEREGRRLRDETIDAQFPVGEAVRHERAVVER